MKTLLTLLVCSIPVLAQSTGHAVTVTINDPQNTGATYAVYRANGGCPTQTTPPAIPPGATLLNTTSLPQTGSSTTYIDSTVGGGQQYCYAVVAITATGPSPVSNDAQATIPGAFAPTITVTVR